MPESLPDPMGYAPERGLWRLLQAKGYEGSFQVFRENHPFAGTPESMIGPLDQEGIQARLALIQVQDLRYLERPTLVQLKDGSWAMLKEWTRQGCLLETPRGDLAQTLQELAQIWSGLGLDLAPPLGPGSLWRRLRSLAGAYRPHLVQVLLTTLILQALGLAGPFITGLVLNRALPDGAETLLVVVAVGIVLTALFQGWLNWLRGRFLLFMVNRMEVAAERGFLDHVLRLPFAFLQGTTLGDLLQAFGGLSAARELAMEKTLSTLLDGVMALVFLGAMVWVLPVPALVVLLATVVMAGATVATGRVEARIQRRLVETQATQRGYLSEILAGIGTLKAAGAERPSLLRWQGFFQKELRLGLREGQVRLWADAGLGLVSQGMASLLLIWGGWMVLEGVLQVGTLFAFLQLGASFSGAVLGVVDTYLVFIVLGPQLARTEALLAQAPEPAAAQAPSVTTAAAVLMEDIWFRYTPEGPWVLSGFNLQVAPGEDLALQSASGSGKTTILRLLAGLLTPEKGRISIDGALPRAARQRTLYLPQFVQIMGGTVLENLRLYSGGASEQALLDAARRSGLDELLASWPMGYHTILPNGGRSLSGGQRQLIALTGVLASARALLLLDEAMANVDGPRSAELLRALRERPWTMISARHSKVGLR